MVATERCAHSVRDSSRGLLGLLTSRRGLSGTEVLQQLHLRWPELPVIVISGLGDSELARRSLRRGAFDYVHKPFDWDCLHQCVAARMALVRDLFSLEEGALEPDAGAEPEDLAEVRELRRR